MVDSKLVLGCKSGETKQECLYRIKDISQCLKQKGVFRGCNITNEDLITGDFDGDKIPNIDDKHPFIKMKNTYVSSISLAQEYSRLKKEAESYKKPLNIVLDKLKGYKPDGRIKHPYSIFGKLISKYGKEVKDFAGVRIITDNYKDLEKAVIDVNNKFIVNQKEFDDYYSDPKDGYYRAFHLQVIEHGKPIEVQVRTKRTEEISKYSHDLYKQRRLTPEVKQELIKIGDYADKLDKGMNPKQPKVYRLNQLLNRIVNVN